MQPLHKPQPHLLQFDQLLQELSEEMMVGNIFSPVAINEKDASLLAFDWTKVNYFFIIAS